MDEWTSCYTFVLISVYNRNAELFMVRYLLALFLMLVGCVFFLIFSHSGCGIASWPCGVYIPGLLHQYAPKSGRPGASRRRLHRRRGHMSSPIFIFDPIGGGLSSIPSKVLHPVVRRSKGHSDVADVSSTPVLDCALNVDGPSLPAKSTCDFETSFALTNSPRVHLHSNESPETLPGGSVPLLKLIDHRHASVHESHLSASPPPPSYGHCQILKSQEIS